MIAMASESDVEAAAEQVGVERDVAGRKETAIEPAVEVAEIDVEILGLHAHIADDARFETDTDGPARVAGIAAGQHRRSGSDVAGGDAAGDVGQEAVEGVAQAA